MRPTSRVYVTVTAVVVFTSIALAVAVPIFYQSAIPGGELDSLALWVAPDPAASVLFVTDKTGNSLAVFDPGTNTYLGRLGSSGTGPGQFRRPNGVAVSRAFDLGNGFTDVLFVVERDNERVSMFSLPDRVYRGSFGPGQLDTPYGIALAVDGGVLFAWITSVGASRVDVYRIGSSASGLTGTFDRSFDTDAVLESIAVDAIRRRVLVADEAAQDVMVFDYAGTLLQRFGAGHFTEEPEGISIYETNLDTGYLIVTDQYASPTQFEVFDRATYAWIGQFNGTTTGTDGITLTQYPLPNLPQGSFYAVHSDQRVHCYNWNAIAAATGLQVVVLNPNPTSVPEQTTSARSLQLGAFPNPFEASTRIRFALPRAGEVDVGVFDVAGRRRATIAAGPRAAGLHELEWSRADDRGRDLPGGVYFCRITAGAERRTLKLVARD